MAIVSIKEFAEKLEIYNKRKKQKIGILELENNKIISACPYEDKDFYLDDFKIICAKCENRKEVIKNGRKK